MQDTLVLIALFAVVAGPVILIWGIVRSVFFGAVEIAGQVSGGQQAVTAGKKGYRRGTILIVIGLVLTGFAIAVFSLAK